MIEGGGGDLGGGFDADAYLHVLALEGAAVVRPATAHGLNTPVPNCPGWTSRDLLAHLAWVYRWVTVTVRDARPEPPSRSERETLQDPDPSDDAGLLHRVALAHSALLATLREAPVDLTCWTAWPATSARAFWIRRQVFETLIQGGCAERRACDGHRGRRAAGRPRIRRGRRDRPRILQPLLREPALLATRQLSVHATDVGEGWWISTREDGHRSGRGIVPAGSSDAEVRAGAGQLLLLLWNRRTAGGLEVRGDPGVLDIWRRGAHR